MIHFCNAKCMFKQLYIFLGDISVVAALGDGILAGKGALADNLADMSIEYKGVSFATGKTLLTSSLRMV